MTTEINHLIEFCAPGYYAIEQAAKILLDGKTKLPNGNDCPRLRDFPEQCRHAINEVTHEQLVDLLKLLEILESSIDKEKFGLTYIEINRSFKTIAENKTIYSDPDHDKEYKSWIWANWINLCLRTNESRRMAGFFVDIGINTEKELFQFAKQNISIFDQNNRVASMQVMVNWFLQRYDLSTASTLIRKINQENLEHPESFLTRIRKNLSSGIIITTVFALILVIGLIGYFKELKIYSKVFHPIYSAFSNLIWTADIDLFTTLLVIFYISVGLVLLISMMRPYIKFFRCLPLSPKLLIPRMVGGIVVGYLPILFSDETWRTIDNLSEMQGALLFAFAILFSGTYLFWEVKNTIQDNVVAFLRSLRVLCLGLLESFVTGLVISDLLTSSFLKHSGDLGDRISPLLQPGLFGEIYPKMLVLYFPLALLIGIFVQIIWEDKPVTQPI